MRNCVLMCSAGNGSDCWCVPWFRVRAGVAKTILRLWEPLVPIFCSHNVTSEIKLANTCGASGHPLHAHVSIMIKVLITTLMMIELN